ncbi:hypothetical protein [Planktotalea sp.]|uniref:hypothetical protein n=1 Tax=Planktotalea sp. TaxID=2029877 RepID=UPI00329A31E0
MHRLGTISALAEGIAPARCIKAEDGFTPAPVSLLQSIEYHSSHDLRGDQIWARDGCEDNDYVIYNQGMTPVTDIEGNSVCPTK